MTVFFAETLDGTLEFGVKNFEKFHILSVAKRNIPKMSLGQKPIRPIFVEFQSIFHLAIFFCLKDSVRR